MLCQSEQNQSTNVQRQTEAKNELGIARLKDSCRQSRADGLAQVDNRPEKPEFLITDSKFFFDDRRPGWENTHVDIYKQVSKELDEHEDGDDLRVIVQRKMTLLELCPFSDNLWTLWLFAIFWAFIVV